MTAVKSSKKLISVLLALAMLFSSVICVPAIQAYAASLSKPTVTLTNTAPTTIKVSWKKVSGATKYTVYRATSKNGTYKALKTTTSTYYSSTKLTCGKTYYFKVKAVSGSKSATSSVVSKKAVPAKVTGLGTTATCSTIKLSWSKQSGVSGYQIYYKTTKNGSYKKLASTSSNTYTVKGLSVGKTRYYKVRSYKKVGSKYYYGSFSAVKTVKTAHSPSTSWKITKEPTCSATGTKVNTCKYCKKTYSVTIAKDASAHAFGSETKTDKNGFKVEVCSICGAQGKVVDYTCYIDLSNETVSVGAMAEFGKSASNTTGVNDKLDLTPSDDLIPADITPTYEIVGSAENLTIDVNASRDIDVRLNGVTINNSGKDCIDIKNKSTEVNEVGKEIVPEVSISAVNTSVNTLITTANAAGKGGNAIDSSCQLTLKGHGTIKINSASTAITSIAKINIKNLTLDITSANRGIDTKNIVTTQDANGNDVVTTDFSSVKIGANASITVNSVDDCIRCKNMEIYAITEGSGDQPTVMNLTSTAADGIQLEGKTGLAAYSGTITIRAAKYAFNCAAVLINISGATVDAKGNAGYSK